MDNFCNHDSLKKKICNHDMILFNHRIREKFCNRDMILHYETIAEESSSFLCLETVNSCIMFVILDKMLSNISVY